jgi:hypothetical protein
MLEVRRIEHHQVEAAIGKGQGPEVHYGVWLDMQLAAIAQDVVLGALVAVDGIRVLTVEPHHSAAAARVEYAGIHADASLPVGNGFTVPPG